MGWRCLDNNIFHSKVEALWDPVLGDDAISESCCREAQSTARDFFQWGKVKMSNNKCNVKRKGARNPRWQ